MIIRKRKLDSKKPILDFSEIGKSDSIRIKNEETWALKFNSGSEKFNYKSLWAF